MKPSIAIFKPTYQKNNGVWVKDLNPKSIQLKNSTTIFRESAITHIPPYQFGGNHVHPRVELFAALSEGLELVWLDDSQKHTLLMKFKHDTDLTFYLIPSLLPHAVYNSIALPAFLLEFASEPQHDVGVVKII